MATSPWRRVDGVTVTLNAAAGEASARRTVQAATTLARHVMARLYAPAVEPRTIQDARRIRDAAGGGTARSPPRDLRKAGAHRHWARRAPRPRPRRERGPRASARTRRSWRS